MVAVEETEEEEDVVVDEGDEVVYMDENGNIISAEEVNGTEFQIVEISEPIHDDEAREQTEEEVEEANETVQQLAQEDLEDAEVPTEDMQAADDITEPPVATKQSSSNISQPHFEQTGQQDTTQPLKLIEPQPVISPLSTSSVPHELQPSTPVVLQQPPKQPISQQSLLQPQSDEKSSIPLSSSESRSQMLSSHKEDNLLRSATVIQAMIRGYLFRQQLQQDTVYLVQLLFA